MPTLTSLLACEKVILDMGAMPSLINIFQRVRVQADQSLPPEALSPLSWCVFALWQHAEGEHGIEYMQHSEIVGPEGKLFAASSMPFKLTEPNDFHSKNFVQIFGIPASIEGEFTIRVRLNDGPVVGEYRFFLEHVRKETDDNASTSTVI